MCMDRISKFGDGIVTAANNFSFPFDDVHQMPEFCWTRSNECIAFLSDVSFMVVRGKGPTEKDVDRSHDTGYKTMFSLDDGTVLNNCVVQKISKRRTAEGKWYQVLGVRCNGEDGDKAKLYEIIWFMRARWGYCREVMIMNVKEFQSEYGEAELSWLLDSQQRPEFCWTRNLSAFTWLDKDSQEILPGKTPEMADVWRSMDWGRKVEFTTRDRTYKNCVIQKSSKRRGKDTPERKGRFYLVLGVRCNGEEGDKAQLMEILLFGRKGFIRGVNMADCKELERDAPVRIDGDIDDLDVDDAEDLGDLPSDNDGDAMTL